MTISSQESEVKELKVFDEFTDLDELFGISPTPVQPTKPLNERSVTSRWHHAELFDEGFVGVPIHFLELYSQLNPPLTSGEALFVIHLMSYKWDKSAPFPSYKVLAQRMGLSDKAVRRHAQALHHKKYLRRIERIGTSNKFDLSKLFDALLEAKQRLRKRIKQKKGESNND